jgi:hypothetical protein
MTADTTYAGFSNSILGAAEMERVKIQSRGMVGGYPLPHSNSYRSDEGESSSHSRMVCIRPNLRSPSLARMLTALLIACLLVSMNLCSSHTWPKRYDYIIYMNTSS